MFLTISDNFEGVSSVKGGKKGPKTSKNRYFCLNMRFLTVFGLFWAPFNPFYTTMIHIKIKTNVLTISDNFGGVF